jgi:ketosteroid isomerase-like protein
MPAETDDLFALEKKYWTAMIEHDLQTAVSLTDFPCVVAGPQGARSVDRDEFEQMFNSHEHSIRDVDFQGEPEVRMVNPGTAVIAYKVRTTISADGHKREMDSVDTSTWIKRDGNWVCAMHTETQLQ